MVEEFVKILEQQLPKYKRIRIPMISDEQAKKILVKLKAKGINVEYNDGWFSLVEPKANGQSQNSSQQNNQPVEQKNEQKVEQEQNQQVEQKPEQQVGQEIEEEDTQKGSTTRNKEVLNTLNVTNSARVCFRIRQDIINFIMSTYNEPNTSNAVRKALYELAKLKGYDVNSTNAVDEVIDVDKLMGVSMNATQGK